MPITEIVLLLILMIFSYVDLKYKEIPSVLLTGTLLVFAILNFSNMQFGILIFIYSYMLYEFDFFGGVADIKILTTIGFMIPSFLLFFMLIFITPIMGTLYKLSLKKLTKKKQIAFIPCLSIVYLILLLLI